MGITLIGLPGAGKSTIGNYLTNYYNLIFMDGDKDILEPNFRKYFGERYNSFQELINNNEDEFIRLERKLIMEHYFENKVFAPGGSVIYYPEVMEKLKSETTVVYLEITSQDMHQRIPDISQRRITGLQKAGTLENLVAERLPLYEKYADIKIDNKSKTPEYIFKQIVDKFNSLKVH